MLDAICVCLILLVLTNILILKGLRKMTITTVALEQVVADLQATQAATVAALDDLAAKLANLGSDDPAVQARVDAAVASLNAIKGGLSAAVAKDDPAPVPAPAA